MKKWRLLVPLATVAALLVLLIAPLGASAAANETAGGHGCVQWHYVLCGQTLAGIARMYGTSVSRLVAINDISNPNAIYAGQSLCVRVGAPPPPKTRPGPGPGPCTERCPGLHPSDGFWYTVRCGDTLISLGWRYGWNAAYLAQVNHLWDPNVIYAGQRLWIPGH